MKATSAQQGPAGTAKPKSGALGRFLAVHGCKPVRSASVAPAEQTQSGTSPADEARQLATRLRWGMESKADRHAAAGFVESWAARWDREQLENDGQGRLFG